jgi:hypothetical protein
MSGGPINNTTFTPSVGVMEQLDETGPIKGTPKPQTPSTSTTPGEVFTEQQDNRPQNDPPRGDPKTLQERYQAILDKLGGGTEGVDMSNLMQEVQKLQSELSKEQEKTQTGEIKNNQTRMEKNAEAQNKKIDQTTEELKKQDTWDTVKKVFSVAAAVLGVIAAIGVSIASGGVGAPLIIAAIGAAVTLAQTFGLTDKLFDLMGASQGVRIGVMIGITAVLAIAGGITAFTSLGSAVIGQAANVTAQVAKMGTFLKIAGTIAQGVSKGMEGVGQIGSSVIQGEVNQIEDERKGLQRGQLRMKQQQDELVEDLKKLMEAMEEGVKMVTQTVQSQSQSVQQTIRQMS